MSTPAPYTIATTARRTGGRRAAGFIGYLTDRDGVAVLDVHAPTAAEARALVLKTAAECLDQTGRITVAFCGDGKTVLILYRGIHGWEYSITDAARAYASGVLMRETDRAQAEKNMLDHADQSYGGTVAVLR